MRLYFIRHAIAMERSEWQDDDLKRPLTKEGLEKFKKFFKKISKNIKKPDIIIASEAVRSIDTAKVVSKSFDMKYEIDSRINPGADIMQYKMLMEDLNEKGVDTACIIGHEPDLSTFISFYIADSSISIKLKKGAFVHIKDKMLYNIIQPDILK